MVWQLAPGAEQKTRSPELVSVLSILLVPSQHCWPYVAELSKMACWQLVSQLHRAKHSSRVVYRLLKYDLPLPLPPSAPSFQLGHQPLNCPW